MESFSRRFETLYEELLALPPENLSDDMILSPLRDKLIEAAEGASQEGHANAVWWLGRTLYYGDWNAQIDQERGFKLLSRAAEIGHMQAQLEIAGIYYTDRIDYKTAYTFYSMAAKSGSSIAKIKTAEMGYYGEGVENTALIKQRSINTLNKMANEENSSYALLVLSAIATNDFTNSDRDKTAFELLERALAVLPQDPDGYASEARLYFQLGRAYHEGIGTPPDPAIAENYISHSASLGDPEALLYLEATNLAETVPAIEETTTRDTTGSIKLDLPKSISDSLSAHISGSEGDTESEEDIEVDFSKIVGWERISKSFDEICNIAIAQNKSGVQDKTLAPHFIVSGPPGSGKDLFIKLISKNLKRGDYLEKDDILTVDLADIMTLHLRAWSLDLNDRKALEKFNTFNEILTRGAGRAIIIKDSRTSDYSSFSPDLHSLEQYFALVIFQFIKKLTKNTLIVLYEEGKINGEVDRLLRKNADLSRCFRTRIEFDDFSTDNLLDIFTHELEKNGLTLTDQIKPVLINEIETRKIQSGSLKVNSHLIKDLLFETYKGLAASGKETLGSDTFKTAAPKTDTDIDALLAPLDNLVGLETAKTQMRNLAYRLKAQTLRENNGITQGFIPAPHFVFTGSPGTGKTTVARMLGDMLKGMGYLSRGHVIETDGTSLLGKYLGQTAPIVQEKIDQAEGGILFIDEAYTLAQNPKMAYQDGYREEAIATLLKLMEDRRGRFIVVAAGYSREMQNFLNTNSGLRSRFNQLIDFESFTSKELITVFKNLCGKDGFSLQEDAEIALKLHLDTLRTVEQIDAFGNARGIRTFFETTMGRQAERILRQNLKEPEALMSIKTEDLPVFKKTARAQILPTQDILKPLDSLLGLDKVKEEVSKLAYLTQAQGIRAKKNIPYVPLNLHSLFVGPAGTGKTTVARLFGRIMHELGYLEKGHVVEVDKGKLTGAYMGQTAPLVLEQVERAEGGILFIDEAYALNDGYQTKGYGDEALSTLLKLMEDRRDRFIVIAAGYSKEMEEFLKINSGLRSRFPNILQFERYEIKTLLDIFKTLCDENHFTFEKDVIESLSLHLNAMDKAEIDMLGNARLIRNIFEKTIATQSARVVKSGIIDERFQIIEISDLTYPPEPERIKIGFN